MAKMAKIIVDNSIITDEDVVKFERYLTELVELKKKADAIEAKLAENDRLPGGTRHRWILVTVRNKVQFNVLAKTTQFVDFDKFSGNYHLTFKHHNYNISTVLTLDEFENWVKLETVKEV